MADKLVSVCINSYNSSKYILNTINSVINQSYKNLQIIVLDDCSTDNTVELIQSIKDDRIEIHSTYTNSFYTYAYNESLKYVKGEYVARLDADDMWEVDKIEKQVQFLEENKEYGACFTHVTVIDENGSSEGEALQPLRDVFDFDNCPQHTMYRHFYDRSNRLCHSSSLIRTQVMKQVGDYDVSLFNLHDFDYWMRLITFCPIYIITEPLTLYRSGGASSDNSSERWTAHHTEWVRVIYRSINMCPDELFLKAFADKLKLSGEHTHKETEIEKALLLLEGPIMYKSNPVLGLYKFAELFKDEEYIKLAKEKFNFSTKDLYKIQEKRCYIDIGEYNHLVGTNKNLDFAVDEQKRLNEQANEELARCAKYITDLEKNRENLEENLRLLNDQLEQMQNSFSWKITKPIRKIKSMFKK